MIRSKNHMPYANFNDSKNLTKIKFYKNKCEIWIRKTKQTSYCLSKLQTLCQGVRSHQGYIGTVVPTFMNCESAFLPGRNRKEQ